MTAKIKRLTGSSLAITSLVLLASLTLLNYWPVLLGKVPLPADLLFYFPPWETVRPKPPLVPHAELGDLVTQFYPWRAFAGEAVRQGVLPLWNPYLLLGTPFLANAQSALFDPLNVIYCLLPTPTAHAIVYIVRTALAGLLTTLFVRSLGASGLGAIAAGIAFAFSGFITVWQGQPLGNAALWLPLVCFGVNRLFQQPKLSSTLLTGVAFALPVLAGHPETAAHITLIGAMFTLYRLVWPSDTQYKGSIQWGRYVLLFVASAVLALGLAAVQILPTLEWLAQVRRTLDIPWGARPLHELLTFFSRDITHNPNSANIAVPEGEAYAGMFILMAASFAPLHRNKRDAGFFFALVAVALQIIYGWGPLYWLSQNAPIMRGLVNWRLLLAVNFGLATLAGLGISALEDQLRLNQSGKRHLGWWVPPILIFTASTVGLLTLRSVVRSSGAPPLDWFRTPLSAGILLLASSLLLALPLFTHINRRTFSDLVLVLLSANLLSFSHGYIPFVSVQEIFPEPPVFRFLKDHDHSLYRVLSVDMTVGSNWEMAYGLSSATGYDEPLRHIWRLLSPLSANNYEVQLIKAEKVIGLSDRRLDLMNVKYLLATTHNASAATLAGQSDRFLPAFAEGSVIVFENRSVLPRAFLLPDSAIEVIGQDDEALSRLGDPTFDPAKTVIVPSMPTYPQDTLQDTLTLMEDSFPAESAIGFIQQGINEISLEAHAKESSILILSQAYYPAWKVTIDGTEAPLLRVDYAFTGVALPAGRHQIRFLYEPFSFRAGLVLSTLAVLLIVGLLAYEKTRPRRKRGKPF